MSKDREIRRLINVMFNLQLRGDYKAANKILKKIEELKNGNK
jgi:hypothetical protein